MPSSFASLHILADGCNDADIRRAGEFLQRSGCRYYNLTAAARYNESEKIIRELRRMAPNAQPLWRGWDKDVLADGTIWERTQPVEWINYRIVPNLHWLKELDVIVVTTNEVGVHGERARQFATWEADCVKLAAKNHGVRLAVLRLSTGNPLETEHANYDVLLKAAGLHKAILSPNEYSSSRGEVVTPWHVGRAGWMHERQDALGVPRSQMVVGEWGIAHVNPDYSLDPYKGYAWVGTDVGEHVRVLKRDGEIYRQRGVSVCVFVFGGWKNNSFSIHKDEPLLQAVEMAAQRGELDLMENDVVTAPVIMPPPFGHAVLDIVKVESIPGGIRNLRKESRYNTTDMGDVRVGDILRRYDVRVNGAVKAGVFGVWQFVEKLDATDTVIEAGWMWVDDVDVEVVEDLEQPEDPPAEPNPVPGGPYVEVTRALAAEMAETHRRLHAAYVEMAAQAKALADIWEKIAKQTGSA